MTNLRSIVKDRESIQKYCSKVIYARIGHAQIVSHKCVNTPEEAKNKHYLQEPLPYIRKILTTDKRVINIHDFHEETKGPSRLLTRGIPSHVLSSSDKEPKEEGIKLAIGPTKPFRIKMRLEVREEKDKWEELYMFDPHTPEECWVWWDGNIFLAYTTDPAEANRLFGHKTRDVLVSLFKDSDLFDGACIGPSPIHVDIMILIFSKERLEQNFTEAEVLRLTRNTIKLDEDIVVPILVDSEAEVDKIMHQAVRDVYRKLHFHMDQFYTVLITRSLLMRAEEQLINKFKQLINELIAIQAVSTFRFWARNRLSKSLSRLISQVHVDLLEEYQLRTHLTEERGHIESLAGRENLPYLVKDYFLEHTIEREYIDRQCISSALMHADQELGRHSAFNVQLMSALLGAAIAVGLMYAGAFLIRLGSS